MHLFPSFTHPQHRVKVNVLYSTTLSSCSSDSSKMSERERSEKPALIYIQYEPSRQCRSRGCSQNRVIKYECAAAYQLMVEVRGEMLTCGRQSSFAVRPGPTHSLRQRLSVRVDASAGRMAPRERPLEFSGLIFPVADSSLTSHSEMMH